MMRGILMFTDIYKNVNLKVFFDEDIEIDLKDSYLGLRDKAEKFEEYFSKKSRSVREGIWRKMLNNGSRDVTVLSQIGVKILIDEHVSDGYLGRFRDSEWTLSPREKTC